MGSEASCGTNFSDSIYICVEKTLNLKPETLNLKPETWNLKQKNYFTLTTK
jgi:hypothetical protein